MRVSSVEQMRRMDAEAARELGIPEELLMENAGAAAAGVIEELARGRWGGIRGRRVVVVCGGGNNGGDGLVVARLLHSRGARVRVALLAEAAGYGRAAKLNHEIVRRLRIPAEQVADVASLRSSLQGAEVVVDAIFGTGLSRPVEGVQRDAILAVNAAGGSGAEVVSLDVPSGVHGDSGAVLGVAVRARHTVAFGLPKLGNLLYPGAEHCGSLRVSHISFPPELYEGEDLAAQTNDPVPLPPRAVDGHKGVFGDALFVAGSRAYLGAPLLAALSHLRSGGGYARLATPTSLVCPLAAGAREVVFVGQPETSGGSLAASAAAGLTELGNRADMVVVGPGLSLDEEAGAIARALIRGVARPLLVDGDGLTHLARTPAVALERKGPLVLTPHPGEHARLLGLPVLDVVSRRVECLREAARGYRAVVVAKGAHTLVGLPDGRVFVNLSGNSGMATPGCGDVLAGVITGMFGLGLAVEDAVRNGVFVHGLAGDLAARELGEDGMIASDIVERIPAAVRALRERREELLRDCYGKIRLV